MTVVEQSLGSIRLLYGLALSHHRAVPDFRKVTGLELEW